ncbi:hypothetical protein GLOIN_2v1474532 [Rhizophagus clarus]|uniref:Uncharacterized protein n=1 Tax=Rhizophagus clarus TaxID=94130 RepID=A0A8H3KS33_9GLOM|nr:hypothetical protein GLOIN_2v1474532 [Rhizophagus clarus]
MTWQFAIIEPLDTDEKLKDIDRLSCNLATIHAKDKEATASIFKDFFSDAELIRLEPDISDQFVLSWKSTVKQFTGNDEYEKFMDRCNSKPELVERMNKIYTDKTTKKLELDNDLTRQIYLHAELNILASVIRQKKKESRIFIGISKRCCYLCELYINFLRLKGYSIFINGGHKKIYSAWKLPLVEDNFNIGSLDYTVY